MSDNNINSEEYRALANEQKNINNRLSGMEKSLVKLSTNMDNGIRDIATSLKQVFSVKEDVIRLQMDGERCKEDLHQHVQDDYRVHKEQDAKIAAVTEKVNGIAIKVASIASVITFIVTIILNKVL